MQATLNKIFMTFLSVVMFNVMYAQCDMPDNTLSINGSEIWYNASSDIGGFQFNVDDAYINGVSAGGDAAANGFTVSSSPTTVLGFSFTGGVIPAGCGIHLMVAFVSCLILFSSLKNTAVLINNFSFVIFSTSFRVSL